MIRRKGKTIAVVFIDMDGTLVWLPTGFSRAAYLGAKLAEFGHPTDSARMEAANAESERWWLEYTDGNYTRHTWKAGVGSNMVLLKQLGFDSGRDVRQLAEELQRHWERIPNEAGEELYSESHAALEMLRAAGMTLAVLSHRPTPLIENSLAQHGLVDYFSFIVSPQLAGATQGKLDRRMWAYALDKAGAPPDRAAHLGDVYEQDVVGARAAGVLPVLMDRNLAHPDADCLRATNLQEAADLILRSPA